MKNRFRGPLHPLLPPLLVIALFIGGVVAIFQTPYTYATRAGDYRDWQTLHHWYSPQQGAGSMVRWSTPSSTIQFAPSNGKDARLRLRLIAPGTEAVPATLSTGSSPDTNEPYRFDVLPQMRVYTLLVPLPAQRDGEGLRLNLTSPLVVSPSETYPQGASIGLAAAQLHGPIRWYIPWLPLIAVVCSALMLANLALWLFPSVRGIWLVGPLVTALLTLLLPYDRPLALQMLSWLPWLCLGVALLAALLVRHMGHERGRRWFLLILTVLLAIPLRFWNLNWDDQFVYHPNEHLYSSAAFEMEPPWNPHFFYYGSLLIYVYRFTAELLAAAGFPSWLHDFNQFVQIGRIYSAILSTATVGILALFGWRWYRYRVGLWAALLLCGTVLAIQNAHFGTTDTLLTLELLLLTWVCLRYSESGSWRMFTLAGAIIGLGLSTKITALSFGIFPATALLIHFLATARGEAPPHQHGTWRETLTNLHWRPALALAVRHSLLFALAAAVACFATAPYYLLDWQGWLENMEVQARVVAGEASHTYQFIGSTPFLYTLYNALFTIGPALLVVGFIAWGHLIVRSIRQRHPRDIILVSGPLAYFLFIGSTYTKYVHYMLPLLPFLCLYAALLLDTMLQRQGWQRTAGWLTGAGTLVLTAGYGIVFALGIYAQPDPRLTASAWIYQNIPWGRVVVRDFEKLPATLHEPDNPLAHQFDRDFFQTENLLVYWHKVNSDPSYYSDILEHAEYFIAGSRIQVTYLKSPERFPVPACFYQRLLSGELGFRPIASFSRGPTLNGWRIDPEFGPWIEETFQVFDHPTILVFAREQTLERTEIEQLLTSCDEASQEHPPGPSFLAPTPQNQEYDTIETGKTNNIQQTERESLAPAAPGVCLKDLWTKRETERL